MFIFDIFKREARRLRTVSAVIAAGMLALLAGLWFVQIVSGEQMESRRTRQSFRPVQVAAERGRVLDRNGLVLVENRAQYNVVLYLESLRGQFAAEFSRLSKDYIREHLPPGTTKLPASAGAALRQEAVYRVASNITWNTAVALRQPATLDRERFEHFYSSYIYMPLPILTNLDATNVAVFSEKLAGQPWLDLEKQPVVYYPCKATAAHLLGYVVRTGGDKKYLPPGYKGTTGIEAAFDDDLRGEPGTNSVLVNNEGYRQREDTVVSEQAGSDIYLTISLPLQQAVESSLASLAPGMRGAAVVMDARTGDVLAMASVPTFDPNEFVAGVTLPRWEELDDARKQPLFNRATDAYFPGSTFKIITTIACLESGVMDVNEIFRNPADPRDPVHGVFNEQGYDIRDTAPPGDYTFEKAFYHSSNSYFCHYGMKAGLRKLLEVARRFHLGEKTDFTTGEAAGNVPRPEQAGGKAWPLNSAPYVAIGQEISVTPLQMAVMISSIANGGTIFWPRVVKEIRSPATGLVEESVPQGRVRDKVALNPQHLQLLRHAMLEDTEHPDANGYDGFHKRTRKLPPQFQVAGKTGTAQVNSPALDYKRVVWFDSYGPFDDPHYAVVVMIVDGASGGTTCAPIAEKIYEAIADKLDISPAPPRELTRN